MHTQILPRKNPQHGIPGQISDLQFLGEIPDDPSAEAWFMTAWGQEGDFPHCPRCERGDGVDFASCKSTMPYRCKHCRKPFSMKIDTLMEGSPLGLKKWAHILHAWTGGNGPSSADELERRSGLAKGIGDAVNTRLLLAATEDVVQLDEDCVLWRFPLGKGKRARAYVVILKGCVTQRTVIGKLSISQGHNRATFQEFIHRNLCHGHCLFMENPNLARDLRKVTPRSLSEMGDASLSRNSLLELQDGVETIINDVYYGVRFKNLDQYLAGIQWWQNYGRLSHRERARQLAQGLRYKTVRR